MAESAKAPREAEVWILDPDPLEGAFIDAVLGDLSYTVRRKDALELRRVFSADDAGECGKESGAWPGLLIVNGEFPGENRALIADLYREKLPVPVIAVCRSDDAEVIRHCFEHGVDDVFVQPLSENLFRAVMNRHLQNQRCRFPGIEVDLCGHTVRSRNSCSGRLTSREFEIFVTLWQADPTGLTRMQIQQAVWQETRTVKKSLDVHLLNLRLKLRRVRLMIGFHDGRFRLGRLG